MCTISPIGDNGITITFAQHIDPTINQKITQIAEKISLSCTGLIEVIPCYTTLSIIYDQLQWEYHELKEYIRNFINQIELSTKNEYELLYIPTLYGGKVGPDIITVSKCNQLTEQEIIELHSNTEYTIYMLGFLPGFPYLGGLNKKIETPRLATPRDSVEAGSVGIAGAQTGIYPITSPGGWNIIGKTPIRLFDPRKENPFLLQAGNKLKFVPITSEEFESIERRVESGEYQVMREVIVCDNKV